MNSRILLNANFSRNIFHQWNRNISYYYRMASVVLKVLQPSHYKRKSYDGKFVPVKCPSINDGATLTVSTEIVHFCLSSFTAPLYLLQWLLSDDRQGSKFKFEFGTTCATRCKFLGAQLKILGAQLIMLGASISKEKVKFICHLQFVTFTSVLWLIKHSRFATQ